MGTSLAEQLQRLAVPQTTVLKRDKKRPSLLFDPKAAAGLKRDTIYQIGLEGLEDLISRNEVFDQFRNSLFHITSRDFERSVQNIEANQSLDKTIRKFLLYLSPYFSLNCTHKALEWLINRYAIHEYNREDLLMLILPYHELNIFVRVVQLLEFKDSKDCFHFLKALQKPGVHLPKQSLLNCAASSVGFLKCVTKYIMQLIKFHEKPNILAVAFNFYCSTFTGALEYSHHVTEDQVSQILPLLLKGLNSPIIDFCAASYVITAKLLAKTSLSDKLLDKFVEKLSDGNLPGLKAEMCLVLLVLYQSQKQYSNVPSAAVANLSEKDWLPRVLQALNDSGSFIMPLLEKLIKRCTEEGTNNDLKLAREMITNFLLHIKLEDDLIADTLSCLLDSIKPKMGYSEDAKNWLTETMQTLERQYPNAFDKEVYRILSATQDKYMVRRRKCLSKILKNTMTYKGKFDVFEKLYHPNPQFRTQAVTYLLENYNLLKETDKEIIRNSLIDRLNDENVDVVQETLSAIDKTAILQPVDLKHVLISLATKCLRDQKEWGIISNYVVNMLCSITEWDWEIVLGIFPYLLPKSTEELKFAKKILQSLYFSQDTLLKPFLEELESSVTAQSFVKLIFKGLQSNSELENVKTLLEVLKKFPKEKRDPGHMFVASLILTNILPENSTVDVIALVLDIFKTYKTFRTKKSITDEKLDDERDQVKIAFKGQFPLDGYLRCLRNVIKKTNKPVTNLGTTDFSVNTLDNKYFVLLSSILIKSNNLFQNVREKYLNYFCDNWLSKVNFVLNLCISQNVDLPRKFKTHALTYLLTNLKDLKKDDLTQFLDYENPTAASLITLLCDSEENVRRLVLDIIDFLIDSSSQKSRSYYYLLDAIKKHREEIIMDHEQVTLIVFNVIDPKNTRGKKHVTDLNSIRNKLLKLTYNTETPIYLKAGILKFLSHINSFDILEETAKLALEILQHNPEVIERFNAVIVGNVVSKIEPKVVAKISLKSNTWVLIKSMIKNDKTMILNDQHDKICPSVLMMNQLEKEIFTELNEEVVKCSLDIIAEIASVAQNPDILPAANRIFKHIDLDAIIVQDQLIKMRDVQSTKQGLTIKRRRVSMVPTVDILDTLEWKKGVSVLEFIQDKKKIRNTSTLLPVLFDVLKRCLDFDEQAIVEYPKQLVLSSILHCCLKANEEVLPENIFNMELIVQCIRASQNPQTHHHALLVLAHTAQLIPTQVLHHMMAIFTFMGSSVLRHDDAYSFQIITKIIDIVIPILVKDNHVTNIANVLRVFVDALLDVPEHRRMPLYQQLLTRVDVKENLFLFLLLVFESQVMHASQEKNKKDNNSKRLEIVQNLCCEFSPDVVLYTCIKLVKYLNEVPVEKDDNYTEADPNCVTFKIAAHTPKDFRHYKYLILKFGANLLASQEFVKQIATLDEQGELQLENLFKEIIVNILQFIQKISKVAEKAANTPQLQYWKVVLHHSCDILDSINALVTPQMFLLITKGLLVHNLCIIRRRILELLNNKLQYNSQFLSECDKKEVFSVIPPIISIVEGVSNDQVDLEQEVIIQTALLSLKLLVKSLGPEDPEKFVPILEFITKLIKSGKAQNNVLASLVLCLAELCTNLKAHAISSLTDFMPAIIRVLKRQKYEETPNVLLRSILTTLEKIFNSMPLFLSPFLEKILVEIALLISKWRCVSDDQKLQSFVNKLGTIKQKIGSVIPPRVLIPAIEQCYNRLIEKKYFSAISAIMDVLAENLSNLKGPEINANLPDLTNFFLNALKFRTEGSTSIEEANTVECHIVHALTVLILKLSESSFRPLYYKLFDWAARSEAKSERLITFYNLSSEIAQSLKGLFVLFAGHFLNNSAQLLDACNTIKNELYFDERNKNILLLEYVLKTLNAVFLYDNKKFINKDRFDVLMQPLVDQLENVINGMDDLLKRNEELLTPCLVNFAMATADDALWKQMNYQILLKMRHNSPKIRLASLHCLTEIVKRLGDDFLPLLPETIPFLAELLEDEEENVEKACQKAVQEMEKVLGEPLQKYF